MRRMLKAVVAGCLVGLAACDSAGPNTLPGGGHPLVPGRIAFSMNVDGNTDIYSVEDGGTGLVRVTTDPAVDGDPSWSPDGSRLAFASRREGETRIFLVNADGTGVVRLTDGSAGGSQGADNSPEWSLDGTRIAFIHGERIFTVSVDGGDTRLFDPPLPVPPTFTCRSQRSPSWTTDGSIVYAEDLCIGIPRVYRAGFDGGIAVLLAEVDPGPSPKLITAPAISSRDQLAYVYSLPDNPDFMVYLSVGSVGGAYLGPPAWSPDGTALVFARREEPHDPGRLYVIGADGTGFRLLGLDADADSPDWTR
jgi:WD40 repeat protein